MAADTLPATLGFLTDAAHLLVSAAPETSAHLMTRRNSLMFDIELGQSDVQRQHVCGCCGHIMIAGHGDELKIDSIKSCRNKRRTSHKQLKKGGISSLNTGCRKTWTCGMCGRYTTISLPPPARVPRRRFKQTLRPSTTTTTKMVGVIKTTTSLSSPLTLATTKSKTVTSTLQVGSSQTATPPSSEAGKVSANASSKKRAKNRKQGLQALLQQSSSSKAQSGLGLSLADFMQS
ncbi:hypothetical protein NPX13_g472 [Xylaria arbuscula]|uniref:Uncharacterized protein n=1 Tax=Xylaria arbuscula TaxID=114810 RepID=A0A9W8NNG9_9PEZI|nr:hypothetical protein NPX13_g472 [Xylaria arbuscula]